MELLKQAPVVVLAAVLLVGLLFVFGVIVRFSLLSPLRTRGARDRLRLPDPAAVVLLTGTPLPDELVTFYRSSPVITRTEFYLVDSSQVPPQGWFIGSSIPLTAQDAKEERAVSLVPGVPIATALDAGCYYLDATGCILLNQLRAKRHLVVAQTAAQFTSYQPLETPGDAIRASSAAKSASSLR